MGESAQTIKKAKYSGPIVKSANEGKVKKHPGGEGNRILETLTYKPSKA